MYAFARRVVFRPSLAEGYLKPGSVKTSFRGHRSWRRLPALVAAAAWSHAPSEKGRPKAPYLIALGEKPPANDVANGRRGDEGEYNDVTHFHVPCRYYFVSH